MNRKGYTLIEIMLVVAIMGTIASVAPLFFTRVYELFTMTSTKMEIQRDVRAALDIINKNLRQASIDSITIDKESSLQPPYSKISFRKAGGSMTMSYYQEGNKLIMGRDGAARTLTENLSFISFTFPQSDDMSIISISLTVEKRAARGQKKAIHVAIEKVRIMNE